jgi:hypothetical protein
MADSPAPPPAFTYKPAHPASYSAFPPLLTPHSSLDLPAHFPVRLATALSTSLIPYPLSLIPYPLSFILYPLSFIPPLSPARSPNRLACLHSLPSPLSRPTPQPARPDASPAFPSSPHLPARPPGRLPSPPAFTHSPARSPGRLPSLPATPHSSLLTPHLTYQPTSLPDSQPPYRHPSSLLPPPSLTNPLSQPLPKPARPADSPAFTHYPARSPSPLPRPTRQPSRLHSLTSPLPQPPSQPSRHSSLLTPHSSLFT